MRKTLVCAAAAAYLGMAGSAVAGGMYEGEGSMKDAPAPMPPVATWTGLYIGGGVGAGAVVHELDVDSYRDVYKQTKSCSLWGCSDWKAGHWVSGHEESLNFDGIGGEGIFGTAQIGYDWQFAPRAVFGVFGDFDWSNIGTDVSLSYSDGYETVNTETELDMEWMWTIGARLGFLPTPDTLVYALAGYSQASFDDADVSMDGFDPFKTSLDTFKGWTVGAGMETRLDHNWGLKLEYRFTQLQDEDLFSATGESGKYWTLHDLCALTCRKHDEYGVAAEIQPSIHTGRVALTYKFNRAPEPIESFK